MKPEIPAFDQAADQVVALGNNIAEAQPEADPWDIADGMLAGAVQYWLYACKPCGDPHCEDCAPVATAEGRVTELKRLLDEFARNSEYFHSPDDLLAGRA